MRILFSLCALLIGTAIYAQTNDTKIDREVSYNELHLPSWFLNSPGHELRTATKHYYTGLAITTISSYMYGSSLMSQDGGPGEILKTTGIAGLIIGGFLLVESQVHIHRAGIILDARGVGIKVPIGK
jgi:hypothetical protein